MRNSYRRISSVSCCEGFLSPAMLCATQNVSISLVYKMIGRWFSLLTFGKHKRKGNQLTHKNFDKEQKGFFNKESDFTEQIGARLLFIKKNNKQYDYYMIRWFLHSNRFLSGCQIKEMQVIISCWSMYWRYPIKLEQHSYSRHSKNESGVFRFPFLRLTGFVCSSSYPIPVLDNRLIIRKVVDFFFFLRGTISNQTLSLYHCWTYFVNEPILIFVLTIIPVE